MKILKCKKFIWMPVLMAFSLLLTTCFNPLEDEGMADFSINLGGNESGRAAVPYPPDKNPESMALLNFKVIFTPIDGGADWEFSSEGNDKITGTIFTGTYNVTMDITLLSNGSPFAWGEALNNPVTISKDSPNIIPIEVEQLKFTVRFENNGGSGPSFEPITDILASHDTTIPIQGALLRTGYTFVGWNTKADGSGTNYEPGASFTPTGDITLYAKWVETTSINYLITAATTGLTTPRVGQALSGATITYTLSGGNYATTITPANFAVTGLPAWITPSAAVRTSNTVVTINLSGTPTATSTAVNAVLPAPIPAANVTGATSAITPTGTVTVGAVAAAFTITASSTGLDNLRVGQAVTGSIVYTLANGTYATTIVPANFAVVSGLPAGLAAGTAARTNGTVVTIAITGTPTTAGATNITLPATIPAANVTEATSPITRTGSITASEVTTGIAITASSTGLDNLRVGQILSGATIIYTLAGGTYATTIVPTNFAVVSGLPTGLTAGTAVRTSDTVVTITITGTPTTAGATNITLPATIPATNVTGATSAITRTGTVTASAVAAAFTITASSTGLDNLRVGQAVNNASIVYTLANGTYMDTITATNFAVSGLPVGLTAATALRTSDTVVTIAITGSPTTVNANTAAITLPANIPAANVTGATSAITRTGTVTASAVAAAFTITASSTGLTGLMVGQALSGATITYTLNTGSYTATIIPANFAVSGLPTWITAAPAVRTGNTVVTINLSGTPTATADAVNATLPAPIPIANVTGATSPITPTGTVTVGAVTAPAPSITVTASGLDDLKVGQNVSGVAMIFYTLSTGTYVTSITAANFTTGLGLPSGLTPGQALLIDPATVRVFLSGSPLNANEDPVNITVPSSIPAAAVTGATGPVTVSGTIQAGPIARGDGAEVRIPTMAEITPTRITVYPNSLLSDTGQTIQYAISTNQISPPPETAWTIGREFTVTEGFYYIWSRSALNTNYNEGTPARSEVVRAIEGQLKFITSVVQSREARPGQPAPFVVEYGNLPDGLQEIEVYPLPTGVSLSDSYVDIYEGEPYWTFSFSLNTTASILPGEYILTLSITGISAEFKLVISPPLP